MPCNGIFPELGGIDAFPIDPQSAEGEAMQVVLRFCGKGHAHAFLLVIDKDQRVGQILHFPIIPLVFPTCVKKAAGDGVFRQRLP